MANFEVLAKVNRAKSLMSKNPAEPCKAVYARFDSDLASNKSSD